VNSGTVTAKQRRRRIATIAGATTVLVIGVSVTAAQAWPSHGGRSGRDRAPSATAPTATAAASATATPASTATTQPSATVSATGSSSSSSTTAPAKDTAVKRGDVIANLFEWNWASVGKECTTVLGPNGYGGVQVSPPQDSIKLGGSNHPWWEVYQPAGTS
jgi:alpha-amylase